MLLFCVFSTYFTEETGKNDNDGDDEKKMNRKKAGNAVSVIQLSV